MPLLHVGTAAGVQPTQAKAEESGGRSDQPTPAKAEGSGGNGDLIQP